MHGKPLIFSSLHLRSFFYWRNSTENNFAISSEDNRLDRISLNREGGKRLYWTLIGTRYFFQWKICNHFCWRVIVIFMIHQIVVDNTHANIWFTFIMILYLYYLYIYIAADFDECCIATRCPDFICIGQEM